MSIDIAATMAAARRDTDALLAELLPQPPHPLAEVMRAGVLTAGKRLRPLLVLESARACGGESGGESGGNPLYAAAAIEAIHAFSLAHDDLPCMDDGIIRHGQPVLHRRFGEAKAVLAGNAMLALAFAVLARKETHPDSPRRVELAALAARAAGEMIAGQTHDLAAPQEADAILALHKMKTGALMAAACEMGAILAGNQKEERKMLAAFGQELGLAFQIADDIGAAGAQDKKSARPPPPDLSRVLGHRPALCKAREAGERARAHLAPFGDEARVLAALIDYTLAGLGAGDTS